MNLKTIIAQLCIIVVVAGCQSAPKRVVTKPRIDLCPMPTGYILAPAIETAEQSLISCPEKLDPVFMKLLEIAKHRPETENRILLKEMFIRLVNLNLISERYAKDQYNKHFDINFSSLPDIRTYNLPVEIDSIKKDLRKELVLKRVGLLECCADSEAFKKAEDEYARLVNFLENMVLNEQYMKGNRGEDLEPVYRSDASQKFFR